LILCLSASAAFAVEEKKADESSRNKQALIRKAAMCAGVVVCIGGAIYLEKQHGFFSNCWSKASSWWQQKQAQWALEKAALAERIGLLLEEHSALVAEFNASKNHDTYAQIQEIEKSLIGAGYRGWQQIKFVPSRFGFQSKCQWINPPMDNAVIWHDVPSKKLR
jgi:hypothetical protein